MALESSLLISYPLSAFSFWNSIWMWRYFFTIVALAFLVVASLPYALSSLVETNWFREQVARFASSELGRSVRVKGDIQLRLGLTSSLELSQVAIDNLQKFNPQAMLEAGRLRLEAPLLPNILGKYEVTSIEGESVKVHLGRGEESKLNWDLGGQSTQEAETRQENSADVHIPMIRAANFKDISVISDLGASRRTFRFNDITAKNLNFEEQGELSSSLTIDNVPIELSGLVSSIQGLINGKPFRFQSKVSQQSNIIQIDGVLNDDGVDRFTVRLAGDDLRSLDELFLMSMPDYGAYSFESKVTFRPGATQKLKFSDIDLSLAGVNLKGLLSLSFAPGGAMPFQVDLENEKQILKASGTFHPTNGIQGEINLSVNELSHYSRLAMTELPNWTDFSLRTKLDIADLEFASVSLSELVFASGESELAGNVEAGFSPLRITANLQSPKFVLTSFIPEAQTDESEASEKSEEFVVPFELLDTLSINIDLDFAELVTPLGFALQDLKIQGNAGQGRLTIPHFETMVFGGEIKGDLESTKQKSSLKLKAKKLNAESIIQLVESESFLKGDFDISTRLNTGGHKISTLLSNLAGTLELSSTNATVVSSTLDATASGLSQIIDPLFGQTSKAQSECMMLNFVIDEGIAKSRDQVIHLNDVFFFAEGQVNLPRQRLTYNFNVHSTNPALGSLIPPFRAFGELDDISFTPSVSGTLASVADSAEGVADVALGALGSTARFMLGADTQRLKGLALCRKAYEQEQKLVSSRIGNLVDGTEGTAAMHSSWDKDGDGVNDCVSEESCDDSTDYSKPRQE